MDILDGEEFMEHQNALKLAKSSYWYSFLFIAGMLVLSIFKPFGINVNLTFWIVFMAMVFIKTLYEVNKYSYVYFYKWEEPIVILYLTNILGQTKQLSFSENAIKQAKILKFLSTQKGTLILKTYSQNYSFKVLGAKTLQELPLIIEKN